MVEVYGELLWGSRDRIDVGGQCQGDDIGFQAIDHRARLLAGTAVRGADLQGFAGLLFPLRGEGLVDVRVELAGRIVGDVEQLLVLGDSGTGEHREREAQGREHAVQKHGFHGVDPLQVRRRTARG
jgi:hypothetical protein